METARLSRLMLVLVLLALGLIVPVGLIAAAAALFAEGTTRLVAVAVLGVVIAVVLAAWKWLRRG